MEDHGRKVGRAIRAPNCTDQNNYSLVYVCYNESAISTREPSESRFSPYHARTCEAMATGNEGTHKPAFKMAHPKEKTTNWGAGVTTTTPWQGRGKGKANWVAEGYPF